MDLFDVAIDPSAEEWLGQHRGTEKLFIGLTTSNCRCAGVLIRDVRVRVSQPSQRAAVSPRWLPIGDAAGRPVLLDSRLRSTLPRQIPITTAGIGPFRHLSLDLSGEQWAEVLFPSHS
jgi:hypothetical protein